MAATTSSRQAHQAELEEAWRALEELAEEHDAALLQMKACERDVLTTHATLEAERGVLSRMEQDKGVLSARIDVLVADVAASVDLARSAEVERVRAETLADAVQAELHATHAALEDLRAANLDLERDACACHLTYQLHDAQIHRQAGELRAARAELADARERQSEQAIRAAGAERALQALERVVTAADAESGTAGFNSKRSRRRPTRASQAIAASGDGFRNRRGWIHDGAGGMSAARPVVSPAATGSHSEADAAVSHRHDRRIASEWSSAEVALLTLARCLGRQAAREQLARGWSLWEIAVTLAVGALIVSLMSYAGLLHGAAR